MIANPGSESEKVLIVDDEPKFHSAIISNVTHFRSKREVAAELDDYLGVLKTRIEELQEAAAGDKQLGPVVQRLEVIAETIAKAGEIGRSLTADVVLPPAEDLRVKLVPSDSLDRLEEYRADEAKAFLLVGVFGGAVLGILANWVTDATFTITRISGFFVSFLATMSLLSGAWAFQIGRRAARLRSRLLGNSETVDSAIGERKPT